MIHIPTIIAASVNGIDINGLIAHPLLVDSAKAEPATNPKQLPDILRMSSVFKLEYSFPKIHNICEGNKYTIAMIKIPSANKLSCIKKKVLNNLLFWLGSLEKRGIINVLNIAVKMPNNIPNRPSAPICATAAVFPKKDISQIVICPERQ